MRGSWRTVALAIVLVIVVILARGYAFVKSHGALQVDAVDVSDTSRSPHLVPFALTFLDEAGAKLASAAADSATGSIYLTSPTQYACHSIERLAATNADARREWSRCFARQSQWLMTWVSRAKFVDIDAPPCALHRNPVAISGFEDRWWLWWLPVRHVGGDPYTYWRAEARFDRANCVGSR